MRPENKTKGSLRETAISLLSRAPLTEKKLEQKLISRHPDMQKDEWDELSSDLRRLGYLRDQELIFQSFQGRISERGLSLVEVAQFFDRHGVQKVDWKPVLDQILEDEGLSFEEWQLRQARRRFVKKERGACTTKSLDRLLRAGFPYPIAKKVITQTHE